MEVMLDRVLERLKSDYSYHDDPSQPDFTISDAISLRMLAFGASHGDSTANVR